MPAGFRVGTAESSAFLFLLFPIERPCAAAFFAIFFERESSLLFVVTVTIDDMCLCEQTIHNLEDEGEEGGGTRENRLVHLVGFCALMTN